MTIVYSKQGCAPCNSLKTLLKKKGHYYIEKDIDDPSIRDELYTKYRSLTVPVTVFDDVPVVGLDYPKLLKLI